MLNLISKQVFYILSMSRIAQYLKHCSKVANLKMNLILLLLGP